MYIRTYSELVTLPTFEQRIEYLALNGNVGDITFGSRRVLNQQFYASNKWKATRRKIILRDNDGNDVLDLAHPDMPIWGRVYIHHLNPITIDDLLKDSQKIYDPENLICVSFDTHNSIHYGFSKPEMINYEPRKPNDTCLWR